MSDPRLEIVIAAKDAAAPVFKKTRGYVQSLTKDLFSLQNVMIGVTGAGTLAAIDMFVSKASDLEEVSSKFGVVFAGQADIASGWVQTLTDDFAMSTRESREYLSSIQDLLVPMGMQSTAAAQLSNEIVKLSADLGSFNNRKTEDVMADIQSGLVGNYETMKKYGIVLTATAVQERALAEGYAKTTEELTAADKALAAYQIMMEGSSAAIGDMQRTSDSYANTTKELDARWDDFSATMGERFLPAATQVKSVTAEILKNLTEALRVGPPTTFEGIDAEIARIESRIYQLTDEGAKKARSIAKEKHASQIVPDGSPVLTVSPRDVSQLSVQIAKQKQALANAEAISVAVGKTAEERAVEKLESEKAYLQDLKRFKLLASHRAKMEQVSSDSLRQIAQQEQQRIKAQLKADRDQEKADSVAKKKMARNQEEFSKKHAAITMDSFALERLEIKALQKKYIEAGSNKIQVNEWVKLEMARIAKEEEATWQEAEKQRLQSSLYWKDGAILGLKEYADSTKDTAASMENAFVSGFNHMEDALVSMASTGKIEFSNLTNSIVADLARITIRQSVTGPLAAAMGQWLGSMAFAGSGVGHYPRGSVQNFVSLFIGS